VSDALCQSITRRSASNLALAFVLLPPARRRAMAALYAFCREVDDVADDSALPPAERRRALAAWREDLRRAVAGETPRLPVLRELQPHLVTYQLPFDLFDEILAGCAMDLEHTRYPDWPELDLYCHRVAAAVGLLSIRIFGCRHPQSADYAEALGRAFQLTNILRDVREDAARGRIYLPQTELARHGVTEAEILEGRYSERFRALAESVAARARDYYARAAALLPAEDRRALIAAELMGAVYWNLLRRLAARGFNVFAGPRARLSRAAKLYLTARTWWRLRVGPFRPNYGVP
jgi:phytoene synthase